MYLVLKMPLRRASRDFQFINTCHPDERTFPLKSMDKIRELPDNSEDIESDNLLKRYQRRPRQLEKLCSVEFAAWYNYVRSEDSDREIKCMDGNMEYPPERGFEDNLDDDIIVENENKCSEVYFLGRGAKVVRRKKCKIIRSVPDFIR